MRPDVAIVGQGLAGTLLAWAFERAGIDFEIVDSGHAGAATLAAAGIINPITGRRLVPSWRIETLLPLARAVYRGIESALGVSLWRDVRVHRLFADAGERAAFDRKRSTGELAAFVGASDEQGFGIEGAAQVDLIALLTASRTRWIAQGRLRSELATIEAELATHALVVDCRGVAGAREGCFGFVPWEYSQGERLEISIEGLTADVILNRRHWVLPIGVGAAWVGATHRPGVIDPTPTMEGRTALEASARSLVGPDFRITGHKAGVRVTLPDKRPVAGRHSHHNGRGIINGLGGKGALWAPFLAAQWVAHLTRGGGFNIEIDVARFA